MSKAESPKFTISDNFAVPDWDEWLSLVESQNKGVPAAKQLLVRTVEDIEAKAIYRREDVSEFQCSNAYPGFAPYVRGGCCSGLPDGTWEIAQKLVYPTCETLNNALTEDVQCGFGECGNSAIVITLDVAAKRRLTPGSSNVSKTETSKIVGRDGTSISSISDIQEALHGIEVGAFPIHIDCGAALLPSAALLNGALSDESRKSSCVPGTLCGDPLSHLLLEGVLPCSLETLYGEMAETVCWTKSSSLISHVVAADVRGYAECGAGIVLQLAGALAHSTAHVRALIDRGISPELALGSVFFHFATGSNFFLEIAKYRAARLLWSNVAMAYGASTIAGRLRCHADMCAFTKTIYDPHVNILRSTVEALSAIVGGVNLLTVSPFDEINSRPSEFSRRIARNIQIIIREESHLDKVIDPGGGAYLIESLTENLARKAWAQFQDIERQGGAFVAMQNGHLQELIQRDRQQFADRVAIRRDVVVGTSMYVDLRESHSADCSSDNLKICSELEKRLDEQREVRDEDSVKKLVELCARSRTMIDCVNAAKAGAFLSELSIVDDCVSDIFECVDPVCPSRLAQDYEKLRQAAKAFEDSKGKALEGILISIGQYAKLKPRIDFVREFIAPGGFRVAEINAQTLEGGVTEAVSSTVQFVVLCISDDDFAEIGTCFVAEVKKQRPDVVIVLAGMPGDLECVFRQSGVDGFIHRKSRHLEVLQELHQIIGVSV